MTKDEIKESYKIRDVAEANGLEVDSKGFCRCPFHSGDDTPSLKIYDNQNTFFCYACQAQGDVITFTMRLYGISFKDACIALSGAEADPITKYTIRRQERQRRARERKKQDLNDKINELNKEIRKYWQYLMFDEPMSDEWVEDYNKWQMLTYKSDVLMEQMYDKARH